MRTSADHAEYGWHSESGSDTVYDYCPKHAITTPPAAEPGAERSE